MSHSRSLWSKYLRRRLKKARKRPSLNCSPLAIEEFEPRIVLTTTSLDLNPTGDAFGSATSSVEFTQVGDMTFFAADNGQNGNELWVTDGTVDGTREVLDINPGSDSSNPGVFKEFNGELYFVADDGTNGEELWKSDGTASGTVLLSDINPGSGYQFPYGDGPLQSFPRDLIEVNGMLIFSAEDATNGAELWRTDGTAAGTMMVADIFPGTFTDSYGTYPNSSNPTGLTVFNGEVYFAADDGVAGRELWKTDGTASGTVRVSDLYTGEYNYIREGVDSGSYPNSSSPTQFTVSGDTLFFVARDGLVLGDTAADDVSNYELWKTDGTDGGTTKVREIDSTNVGGLTTDSELFDVGGLLVFAANDGISGDELWRSNGTEEGTIVVREFESGEAGNLSSVAYFAEHQGVLYFTADDVAAEKGFELWRTNGTFLGTEMVIDINPGEASGFPVFMESIGDFIYFTANDGDTGFELWRSDGTEDGTLLLEDLIPGEDDAQPSSFGSVGDTLLFTASNEDGRELWMRTEDARDATAKLIVYVEEAQVDVPANIGVSSNGDTTEITTNSQGELAFNTGNDSTLGDFFNTWRVDAGQVANNSMATLSSTELLGNVADGDNSVQMLVNGEFVTEFEQYVVRPDDTVILIYGDNPVVSIQTNFGPIVVELFEEDTPITVDNFLNYVNDGDYVNSFFHRAAELGDGTEFVIQGGGFRTTSTALVDINQLTPIPTDDPIQNEPGIPNTRGTISMAKLDGDPDSATSQFFVNLEDNRSILDGQNGGFTVFGQVLDMTSADAVAALPAVNIDGGVFGETPLTIDDTLVVVSAVAGNGGIAGRHFGDLNENGQYDAGEETAGVMVFADANGNGILDAGESSATTDATGRYLLQVAPGDYLVTSLGVTETQPQSVTVETGRDVSDVDFVSIVDLVAPTSIDLIDASDLGSSNTDNLTRLNNSDSDNRLQFFVDGVINGAEVRIYSDGVLVGSGMSFGTTVTVATDGASTISNGAHAFTATVAAGTNESGPSPALSVEVSSVTLGGFTSAAPTIAQVGQTLTVDVQSGDEGSVAYSLVNAPTGMVIDATTGALEWTPAASQAVPVSFDIVASDAAGNSITQVVDLNVVGVIAAMDDAYSVDEDGVLNVTAADGVLANDGDANNATVSVREQPSDGALTLNSDGSFTYTPEQDFSGTDTFSYLADNGADQSNVATVTITVNAINDVPVAVGDSYTTPEDTVFTVAATGGVLANDTDADNDSLSVVVVTQPTDGTLVLLPNGAVTYTPDANFVGSDSFQYEVSDGTATAGPVDVSMEVTEVNDSPIANSESFTLSEDGGLTVSVADGVLANDTDEEGDNLTASLSTQPQNGVVGLNSDGSFTYTPTANFFGTDTFGYRASDGTTESDESFVTINVTSVADAPTANDDSFDASNDGVAQELDVLANDSSEPDGTQTLTITAVTQGSEGGTLTINSDGSAVSYASVADATGTETFTYTIEDSDGLTSTATATVSLQADAGDSVISGFVYLDRSTDGVRDSGETGLPGSLVTLSGTDNAGNLINETALTTDTGFYSFEEVKTGTYVITQTQPAATVDGMTTADMDAANVAANEISNVIVSGGETLIENNFGEETVRAEFMSIVWYFASSASGMSETEQLREVVADAEERAGNLDLATSIRDGSTEGPVNTAPVALTDSYTVIVNGTLDVTAAEGILANDTDLNGDTLSATLDDTTDNGTLALDPDGSFTYTPDADYTGFDTFTYFAEDGTDQSNNVLVTIIVDPEAPVETDDNEFSISENTPSGTSIGSVTPSAALGSERIYEIVDSAAASELALKADDNLSGEPDAQVVLVEYLSFQCPTCAQFHSILEDVKEEFDDELLVVSRHLPLDPQPFPFAREAAQNAEAAGRQGMFDEMADLLFTNQSEWSSSTIPQVFFDGYAASLGLDMTQFAADRLDAAIDAGISADEADAAALNATGTPTLFLEGRQVDIGQALTDFSGIVEQELDDYDAPFIVDRLSGEILVSPVASFNASSTSMRTFDVRVTDSTGATTTETVTVNISASQAAQAPLSSSAAVDAAFAELG